MTHTNRPKTSDAHATLLRSAIEEYGRQLHGYLRRLLRNPEEARDVWQEAFIELWRTKHIELIRDPQAYVYKIAWRVLSRRKLRAQHDRVSFDSDTADKRLANATHLANSDVADEVALESDLENAFCRLSAMQQSVLLLSLRRRSDAQIADELGLSEHTVRKYLKTAKAQLRKSCTAENDPAD